MYAGPAGKVATGARLREDAGMTEQPQQQPQAPVPGVVVTGEPEQQSTEAIASPAKVMRIGAMVRQLLEEVRHAPLDEAGRDRMREIYDISVRELSDSLSPDLAQELSRVARPFVGEETPSEAELRVAQAQLVGWLEGLFHGIQATLFAQQMSARNQLEEMRRRAIPGRPGPDPSGQYL
jgi:Bacterial proteasome activator